MKNPFAPTSNFYLDNPMDRYEYMKLPLNMIQDEIIQQWKLQDLAHKLFLHMEIQKGMNGMSQAGKISNSKLKGHISKSGCEPSPITRGLWRHQTRPLQF